MSTHKRHPVTGIDRRSSFKALATMLEIATYQTKFIDIGMLAHIVGQVPVGHPWVHKGDRRKVGAEPKETDHIWMS